ncbi:MAG: ROK family protein [Chloroflexi bacterium]|nr:ROK family protein [Chloroflexota bacterium]
MPETRTGRPVLSIDLGGTKIIGALITPDYRVLAKERHPTLAGGGPDAVIGRVISLVDELLERAGLVKSGVVGLSIAVAGAIEAARGVITVSPNLPGWCDIPLLDIVREKAGLRTWVLNDAKAAALGEYELGAGKDTKHLVLLTIGTGIGGGLILNGELYTGTTGSAGELGHMTIDIHGPKCPCGNTGCLEVLASGTAIAREARRRVLKEKSSLLDTVEGRVEEITAKKVGAAARDGDALSLDVVRHAGRYLGVGLVNLVNIFNPEVIIIGGGVSEMGEMLLAPARELVDERAIPISARTARIITAELGNDAGIFGAAAFAFKGRTAHESS